MTARRRRTRAAAAADERYFVASQWRMMWRKLVRHRLAVIAAAVLAAAYLVAGFAEFVAPAAAGTRNTDFIHAPPRRIRCFSDEGLHLRQFVYGLTDPDPQHGDEGRCSCSAPIAWAATSCRG